MAKFSPPTESPYVKPIPNHEPQLKIETLPMPTIIKEPDLPTKAKGKAQPQASIITRLPGCK